MKVASEVTLTLEADGDPSTFSMTLNVLRSTNADTGKDEMMRLVRYSTASFESTIGADTKNEERTDGDEDEVEEDTLSI